jgi:hypothetical protein
MAMSICEEDQLVHVKLEGKTRAGWTGVLLPDATGPFAGPGSDHTFESPSSVGLVAALTMLSGRALGAQARVPWALPTCLQPALS